MSYRRITDKQTSNRRLCDVRVLSGQ